MSREPWRCQRCGGETERSGLFDDGRRVLRCAGCGKPGSIAVTFTFAPPPPARFADVIPLRPLAHSQEAPR